MDSGLLDKRRRPCLHNSQLRCVSLFSVDGSGDSLCHGVWPRDPSPALVAVVDIVVGTPTRGPTMP